MEISRTVDRVELMFMFYFAKEMRDAEGNRK